MRRSASISVVRWTPADARARVVEAMGIYAEAMGYPPEAGHQRSGFAMAHTRRAGFRAVAALDGSSSRSGRFGISDRGQPALVGFGYGYATAAGQWWHDQVRAAISADLAAEWLDGCFELSELHVRPAWQGQGLGRSLLIELVNALPTPEGDSRAWRLYRSLGFVDPVRDHLFPGDNRPFAVLGVRLPLPGSAPGGSGG